MIFTVYATIFGQFTAVYVGLSEKVRYLALDLLKRRSEDLAEHPKEEHNEGDFKH